MQLHSITKSLLPLLSFLLFTIPTPATQICEEDELVAICSDGQYAATTEYFDSAGIYAGSIPSNYGGYEIGKVKKGTLKEAYVDKHITIYKYDSKIEKIAEYPMDLYGVLTRDHAYLLSEYGSDSLTLYSPEGYVCDFQAEIDWSQYNDVAYMNWIKLECTPSGYFLEYIEPIESIAPNSDATVIHHLTGVSDGGWMTDIIKETMSKDDWEDIFYSDLSVMGDYIIYQGNVYDLDGNCHLQNVECIYGASDEYDYNPPITAVLQLNPTSDGTLEYTLYDDTLTQTKQAAASPELLDALERAKENPWLKELKYKDGVFTMTPSEKLAQETCSGFIPYCGPAYTMVMYLKDNVEAFVPYARTKRGAYVSLKGNIVFVRLEEDERLISINDYLCVTGREGYYGKNRIRRLDNSEVILEVEEGTIYLEHSYALVEAINNITGYFEKNIYEIDKKTYEIKKHKDTGAYMPWSNDCFVTSRSIYKGITDAEGNWIAKIINKGTD